MLYWNGYLVIFNPEHVCMGNKGILTISRAVIQACIGGSGWLSKGPELSSIFNYHLSLVRLLRFSEGNCLKIGQPVWEKNSAWIQTICRNSGEVIERMLLAKFHAN